MTADPVFQTIILQGNMDEVAVSFGDQISDTVYSEVSFRTPAEFAKSSAPSGHTLLNTVPVSFIKDEEKLPAWFFQNIPQGSKEFFARQANLRYSCVKNLIILTEI